MNEPRQFTSRVFGDTRDPTPEEVAAVEKLVADVPVTVFQHLNRSLNARGLLLAIEKA